MSNQTSQSERKHTPEPLNCIVRSGDGLVMLVSPSEHLAVATMCDFGGMPALANGERLAACYSALAGIPDPSAHTEAVKGLVEAAKAIIGGVREKDSSLVHPKYRHSYNRDYHMEVTFSVGEIQDLFDALAALTSYQQSVGGANA